jgi:Tfp pilus assembly protein PilN
MIEINLLGGARKAKRGKAAAVDFSAMFANASTQVKDPWLAIAAIGLIIGLGLTGYQYYVVRQRTGAIEERMLAAEADTATYSKVLRQRSTAAAQRDSILGQFAFIKKIDRERYTWPHVLDELSAALPPYTWILIVKQTSLPISIAPPPPPPAVDSTKPQPTPKLKSVEEIVNAINFTPVTLQVVGQTVDVQAMTRFMRMLEASPFIENVVFVRSDTKPGDGTNVIEFTIDMKFQTPPPSAIRTTPFFVATR